MNVRFPWLVFWVAGLYILFSHLPKHQADRFMDTILSLPAYGENPALHLAKLCVFLIVVVGIVRLLRNGRKKED